jgi:hypothetical protein
MVDAPPNVGTSYSQLTLPRYNMSGPPSYWVEEINPTLYVATQLLLMMSESDL